MGSWDTPLTFKNLEWLKIFLVHSIHQKPCIIVNDLSSRGTNNEIIWGNSRGSSNTVRGIYGVGSCTGRMGWMAHRKWEEIKQQPSMLPGLAVPGSCLASFHFRWAIHPIRPVQGGPTDFDYKVVHLVTEHKLLTSNKKIKLSSTRVTTLHSTNRVLQRNSWVL